MASPSAPRSIDRFEVLGVLGEGAMGQVLRARDPRLDREVAIKLLRPELDDARTPLHAEEARKRLIREARAMARLDHPNVIGIHEVGETDGRVYLVMERVDGQTLRAWGTAAPRTWPEIRAVYEQIGEGLAAAHAAGLIHRDIKPDNVLIGRDGRVRVTDFGLVAAPGAADTGTDEPAPADERVTHHGAVLGTPGYQAPEILRGGAADARTDQFALCASLFETLHGRLPWPPGTHRERVRAILEGRIAPPAGRADLPAHVDAAIVRGLAVDPAARWPDVTGLIAALRDIAAPVSARRRPTVALAAGGVVAVGAIATVALLARDDATATVPADAAPPPITATLPAAAEVLIDTGQCDRAPVFVDETTLVYEHTTAEGSDLRVRDLATGADRALTTTPDVRELSPGPAHGERAVVFIRLAAGAAGGGPTRVDVDTGVEAALTGGAAIFFSAGATTARGALFYVVGDGSTLVRVEDGVVTERAKLPGAYIWNFTIAAAAPTAIGLTSTGPCEFALDGPPSTKCFTTAEPPNGEAAITADADIVYYGGLSGIRRLVRSTGADELAVAAHGINGGMALSPSGRTLVWSECQPQIEITDLADRRVVHRESLTGANTNNLGAWAFIREQPAASLVAFRDADQLVHVLTEAAQGVPGAPVLEPDGDRMVFSLHGAQSGLFLTRGTSHLPLRRLTEGDQDEFPQWTADGKIAFTRMIDGLPAVHVVDPETSALVRAHDRPRYTYDRALRAPWLMVSDAERRRLYLWDPATGEERAITWPSTVGGAPFTEAQLAADASFVVIVWGPELWKIDLAGKRAPEKIYATEPGRTFWGVEIGPDNHVYVMPGDDRGAMWRATVGS